VSFEEALEEIVLALSTPDSSPSDGVVAIIGNVLKAFGDTRYDEGNEEGYVEGEDAGGYDSDTYGQEKEDTQ
jgi:hypothetical protein